MRPQRVEHEHILVHNIILDSDVPSHILIHTNFIYCFNYLAFHLPVYFKYLLEGMYQ